MCYYAFVWSSSNMQRHHQAVSLTDVYEWWTFVRNSISHVSSVWFVNPLVWSLILVISHKQLVRPHSNVTLLTVFKAATTLLSGVQQCIKDRWGQWVIFLGWINIPSSIQWFDAVSWVTGRTSSLCHLSSKVLFQNKWRQTTEEEPA